MKAEKKKKKEKRRRRKELDKLEVFGTCFQITIFSF